MPIQTRHDLHHFLREIMPLVVDERKMIDFLQLHYRDFCSFLENIFHLLLTQINRQISNEESGHLRKSHDCNSVFNVDEHFDLTKNACTVLVKRLYKVKLIDK